MKYPILNYWKYSGFVERSLVKQTKKTAGLFTDLPVFGSSIAISIEDYGELPV